MVVGEKALDVLQIVYQINKIEPYQVCRRTFAFSQDLDVFQIAAVSCANTKISAPVFPAQTDPQLLQQALQIHETVNYANIFL